MTSRIFRRDIDIEPAVAVVVGECRHHAGIADIESVRMSHLLERPIALVDIEEIRRVEPANIDISRPSLFTSTKLPLLPDHPRPLHDPPPRPFPSHPRTSSAQVAEKRQLSSCYDKDVGPAVPVVIADRHSGADDPVLESLE